MKPFIIANWKMHKTVPEACAFVKTLKAKLTKMNKVDIAVCAPFTALSSLHIKLPQLIKLGAQNMHYENEGAFTGEISAVQLKEFCEYVLLGHSERRQYFHETNSIVNRKVLQALKYRLKPILCVGERLEERKENHTFDVVQQQIHESLKGVATKDMSLVTIAYEPVWAIGTGVNAIPEQAEEVHAFIREQLGKLYSKSVAEKTRILYGGSVKPENTYALMCQKNINGALVGGASLNAEKFFLIIKEAMRK